MATMDFSILQDEFLESDSMAMNLTLFAYMLYPELEVVRNDWLTSFKTHLMVHEKLLTQEVKFPPGVLAHLKGRVDFSSNKDSDVTLFTRGQLAGEIALDLIRLGRSSFRPAVASALCLTEEAMKLDAYSGFPSSKRSLQNAWSDFSKVSHYWAAWVLVRRSTAEQGLIDLIGGDEMTPLASVGKAILSCLVELNSEKAKKSPMIDEDAAWQFPSTVDLPTMEIVIEPMTEPQEQLLKNNLRRQRKK